MRTKLAGSSAILGLLFLGFATTRPAEAARKSASPSKPEAQTAEAMRLLHANCLSCHNEEKHKGGLVLASRKALLKGGESGKVVLPGQPEKSLLFSALSPDADPHMPPKKQLSTNQIELVRRWIAAGVPWDETVLARAGAPREVKLGELPALYQPVLALALSPDGKRLAAGRGNRLLVYDTAATNFPVTLETNAHRDVVRSLAWSADGRWIASGSFRELAVRDASTLKPAWASTNLDGRVTALRFTPLGGALAAADSPTSGSGWVRLFAVENGNPLAAWPAHGDTVHDLAISPDSGLLATAGGDKLVKLWELVSQKEIARLEGHVSAVSGLAFNTNAGELVTVGLDQQLKVWDVKTRESVITMGGRKHGFCTVAWSADGRSVVAADTDGSLYSFTDFKRHSGEQSSATATERHLGRWPESLHALAVSADARQVFAGGQDGSIFVVNHEGKLLARLEGTGTGGATNATMTLAGKEAAPQPSENAGTSISSTNASLASAPVKAQGKQAEKKSRSRARLARPQPAPPASAPVSTAPPPSFIHDILPLLAKSGCTAGACHAKADGQNGFKLSVFSYDPRSDYGEIVKEGRGRRVFPAAPEESLLLLKPTMAVEHGGGQRFEPGSEAYQTLSRWIRSGMIYQRTNEPALVQISVEPREHTCRKGASQQLRVEARYSDGSTRDVTALADFVSNEKEIAKVDEQGLVRVGNFSGEGVIVARFMGFVDASRVLVPADRTLPEERYTALPVNNFIDELAYAHFRKLGLFPSDLCTDAEFLRRASLDTLGVLPTVEETRQFLSESERSRQSAGAAGTNQVRAALIERLLARPEFADYWANKWADLLRPNPDRVGVKSVFTLDQWLRESFRQNKPYDQFVRDILLAEGTSHGNGPIVIYRDRREPADLTTMFSQLFLGVRVECAKCHHHPNEKWSQDDFYQFAAYFGPLKQKGPGLSPPISAGNETFYFTPGGTVKHPVTDEVMKPRPLDGAVPAASGDASEKIDPRRALADWVTDRKNPFFARAAVNRVWAAFFGRGFVEPVDDFRVSNPATNEPLLDALARDFAEHGCDLKHLIRTILSSRLYQLSATPNEFNRADTKNFSRSYRRRLPAEVLLDAVNDVTGSTDEFKGCPPGTRAIQTWSYKIGSHFLDAFGRPNSSSDCPCERDFRPSVVQSLHLMNSPALQSKLSGAEGRVKRLADGKLTPEEIVTELYLSAFNRFPTAEELQKATAPFAAPEARRQTATEDVLWALLNSAEFVFNH